MENMVFTARSNEGLHVPPRKPPDGIDMSKTKGASQVSFRDKLMGDGQQAPKNRERVDLIQQKLVRIEHEDGNRLLPKVYLDDSVFEGLCSSWKDALVIKLLGKNLGYQVMKERLQKIWRTTGGFDIRDVDNGFFIVKFDLPIDKEKVITQGPWMIFDHYLAVSHWSPEFLSPEAKVGLDTLPGIEFGLLR
ncbi:hypothetical protein P8452_55593 [Trifolium repens]|jgi:hypothetical protein|nr:hypothetical protein P8452_55593 [Trifolium repens]